MKMSRRIVSVLLAVMMLFSMATMAVSAYTVPDGYQVADTPGINETAIDGEVYGLLGDPDLNDRVNVKDATAIQKMLADLEAFDEMQLVLADVDFSGSVNVKDATSIQKWVADMEVDYPINHLIYVPAAEEIDPTDVVLDPTDVVLDPTDVVLDPTDVVLDPTDVVLDPTDAPVNPTDAPTDPTDAPDDGMYTVYFSNNRGWDTVYLYGFYGVEGQSSTADWPCEYPGAEMTFVETNEYGQDVYSMDVPSDIDYIKFTNGGSGSTNYRTNNIPNSMLYDNVGFYLTDEISASSGKKWDIGSYNYAPDADDTEATDPTTTPTAGDEATVDEATKDEVIDDGMYTIYFTNNRGWDTVYIYGFYGEEGQDGAIPWPCDYPGAEMNFVETNQYGQDIYSYEVPEDLNYIKFANGGSGDTNYRTNNIPNSVLYDGVGIYLTDEISASSGKKWDYNTYNYNGDSSEEETTVPDVETTTAPAGDATASKYSVRGSFNNWTDTVLYTTDDVTYTATITVEAGTYEFKLYDGTDWYGNGGTVENVTGGDWGFRTSNSSNCTWNATGGTYLFSVTIGSDSLRVTISEAAAEDPTDAPTDAPVDPTDAPTDPTDAPVDPTDAPTDAPVDPTDAPTGKTAYCINSANWSELSAHMWIEGGAGTSWPGEAMTKTGETVNGFDVYSITTDMAYENIIFNNNNNGSQTANLTFENGKYFDIKSGVWYESLDDVPAVDALATDRYLVGSFNGWSTIADEFKLSAEGDTTGYVTLTLEANTNYEFKIVREGTWTSCKDTLSITGSVSGLTFSSSVSGNVVLTTTVAGEYVFAFGINNSQLSVTYPDGGEDSEEPTDAPVDPTDAPSDPEETETITVYFIDNKGWDTVYIYGFWGVEGQEATAEWPCAYPGALMTFVKTDDDGQDVYSAEVPADINYIKFANGGSGSTNYRTNNIPNSKLYDNVQIYLTDEISASSGKKWDYATSTYSDVTEDPTEAPTDAPTEAPTDAPTEAPTDAPTEPESEASGYKIVAESGNWSDVTLYKVDDTTMTATVHLDAGTYTFRIMDENGTYYGYNSKTLTVSNAGNNLAYRTGGTLSDAVTTLNASAGTYTFDVTVKTSGSTTYLILKFTYVAD